MNNKKLQKTTQLIQGTSILFIALVASIGLIVAFKVSNNDKNYLELICKMNSFTWNNNTLVVILQKQHLTETKENVKENALDLERKSENEEAYLYIENPDCERELCIKQLKLDEPLVCFVSRSDPSMVTLSPNSTFQYGQFFFYYFILCIPLCWIIGCTFLLIGFGYKFPCMKSYVCEIPITNKKKNHPH